MRCVVLTEPGGFCAAYANKYFRIAQLVDYELTETDRIVIDWHLRAKFELGDREYATVDRSGEEEQIAADLLEDNGFDKAMLELLRKPVRYIVLKDKISEPLFNKHGYNLKYGIEYL